MRLRDRSEIRVLWPLVVVLLAALVQIVFFGDATRVQAQEKSAEAEEDLIVMSATWPETYKNMSLEELVERNKGKDVEAWITSDDVLRQSDGSAAIKKSAWTARETFTSKRFGFDWHDGYIHVVNLGGSGIWRVDFTDYTVNVGWPVESVAPADKDKYYYAKNFFFPKDGVSKVDRARRLESKK